MTEIQRSHNQLTNAYHKPSDFFWIRKHIIITFSLRFHDIFFVCDIIKTVYFLLLSGKKVTDFSEQSSRHTQIGHHRGIKKLTFWAIHVSLHESESTDEFALTKAVHSKHQLLKMKIMGDSCSTVQMYTFLYQGCTLTWHHLNLHQSQDQSQIVRVVMAIQNTQAGCLDLVKNIQAG